MDHENSELWVFGYGSLMWRPGFDYLERAQAKLIGLHRSLCVYSHVHRGTPERPGLVLGLDRGGACRGIAYRVAAEKREETIDYLRAREQVTSVYLEVHRRITLEKPGDPVVQAVTYVVDRGHTQYAGRLSPDQQLHIVRQGHGQSGANPDYVKNTVKAIEDQGFRDPGLHWLAARL
jgi:cation transport protein ChaC